MRSDTGDRRVIGVLTSGGDAPGMNAVIAAICDEAEIRGLRVIGIRDGFRGLVAGHTVVARASAAMTHVDAAGTWLGSARHPELATIDGARAVVGAIHGAGLDALIVIGGDGSCAGARRLAECGAHVAFVPATIDNDIRGTAWTIGCDSAVRYGVEAVNRLRITGKSLTGRAFIVQTLGGNSEMLALAVAEAAGVPDVLVPSRPVSLAHLADRLRALARTGDGIAVMSENGEATAVEVAAQLVALSGLRVHATILGHAQRAAPVTARDRRLADRAGRAAVRGVLNGSSAFVAFDGDGAAELRPLAVASEPSPEDP